MFYLSTILFYKGWGMDMATGWIFWAGTVGFSVPVLERLEAATTLGVQRFAVSPLDTEWAEGEGISADELGRRIRGAGCEIIMDPVFNWYGGAPHPGSRFGRFTYEHTQRVSAELGVVEMNFVGQPTHDASPDELASAFATVARRAADAGARACLEFTPISAITDLAAGWDIVRNAGDPNGGLLFDTWHFHRSNSDLALLEQIPGDRIFSVQVSDARADQLPDIRQDTQHRLLPGDGVIDLLGILRVLARTGGLEWVGPEVIAPELAEMSTLAAATLADQRTREILSAVTV